jgi:hypothetical protein
VAAWLSETALRGRGPGASEFESHRRGRIFFKDVCVCLSGADGRVVEGRTTTTARSAGFKSRPDRPPMDVVLCSYCVVQKEEMRGEYPGAPPHHLRKKEGRRRKKQLADRKVPDRPGVVKGESYKKKEDTFSLQLHF